MPCHRQLTSRPGIEFAVRQLLAPGGACVVMTILVGALVARAIGFNTLLGLLIGSATAICGASAALAPEGALIRHRHAGQRLG
ncbi:MAG: putative sulfate exporter family transporter [Burkholderiales bacterium]|jgi:uncharacterized membrane protein YadS|nr:MAG: putative sulfate exporter family transporter [Burkholderiales bacterium]